MTTEPKKEYKRDDFDVIEGADKTGDARIPFMFKSKDGRISANFFWVNGDVQLRAIIGETETLCIGYPFPYSGPKPPDPRRILASLLNRLNYPLAERKVNGNGTR